MVRRLGRGLVLGGSLCVATFSFNACSVSSTSAPATDGGMTTTNPDSGAVINPSDGSTPGDDGATKSALGFTPSNIDLSGIDLTKVGDFVVDNDACTINSENNLASCGDGAGVLGFKLATQDDGTKVAVYVARTMNVLAGRNLTVEGHNPVVFVALDTITITGTFNGNARDDVGIAGGPSQMTPRAKGAGAGGGGGGAGPGAAGAGGSYCGVGGAGASETGTPSMGGATYGSDAITPLVGGSTGGSGEGAGAGSGGGALQLVAGKSITIDASGLVHVGAGGGGFGGIGGQDASGGGSGGSILLESLAVSVAGTLAANGGGGGGGSANGVPGGQNAFGNATPAAGGAAPAPGGAGSAGAIVKGSDGTFTAGGGSAGGGGGGGAGRIRINTKLGQATVTGTLSPSAATTCATQGTVKP